MRIMQCLLSGLLTVLSPNVMTAEVSEDSSLRLPAELLRRNVGLQLLDGMEDSSLNSTLNAQRESPFDPASRPPIVSTIAPNAIWEHELNESVYKFTRESQFGVKASTKGPFFRAAARVNTQKFSSVETSEVLMYAYMLVIAKESQVRLYSITRANLASPVRDLLDQAIAASAAGDQASLRKLRETFRANYGTGFLAGLSEGGMYVIEGKAHAETQQDRDKLDVEIGGAVSGVKAQSTLKTENLSDVAKKFLSKKGQFYGGDPQAADADFESFVKVANQWKTSVLKDASMQDRLSGVFLPYAAVPLLQVLASGPPIQTPVSLHFLRTFGPLDSPQSGVLLSHQTQQKTAIVSSPVFFPDSMVLDPVRGLLELKTRLDVSVVSPGEPRQAALSELKRFSTDSSIADSLTSTPDAPFDRTLLGWPYLELVDEYGAVVQTLEPTDESKAMSDYVDRTVFKSSTTFSFQTAADPVHWQMMISKGFVRLRTALSFNLIDIALSPELVLTAPHAPESLGPRTKLALSDKPWASPTDLEKVSREMESRFNYLAYGPPHRSQEIAPGVVALKARCCRNRATNEYQFVGRYCRPAPEDAASGGERSTRFDPFGKLKLLAPEGMELAVLRQHEEVAGAGACISHRECNDPGEPCTSFFLDKACYVDSAWMAWYRRNVDARQIEPDENLVCRSVAATMPNAPKQSAPAAAHQTDAPSPPPGQ